jgi:hypothetical protein
VNGWRVRAAGAPGRMGIPCMEVRSLERPPKPVEPVDALDSLVQVKSGARYRSIYHAVS